jgi:deazaflavin-dependent oxidoreductase (nitroreductase family)
MDLVGSARYACPVTGDFEPGAADQSFAWLTTTGRRTGAPRTVELWFVLDGRTVYFLSGGGDAAQWVRNARAQPQVSVLLGNIEYQGRAREPGTESPEDARARRSMAAKYQGWREGRPLSDWASEALCLAIDL